MFRRVLSVCWYQLESLTLNSSRATKIRELHKNIRRGRGRGGGGKGKGKKNILDMHGACLLSQHEVGGNVFSLEGNPHSDDLLTVAQ